jgi:hypothetical protein
MLLTPGGVQMREMTGYLDGRIDRPWPARYTWPVIASGTAHTYSVEFAEYLARKQAYRACALLSVIWATCWIPRSGPDVQVPGWPEQGLPAVPQSVGSWESTSHPDESLPADFNVYEGDDPLVLPAWTPRAWDVMEQDETVRRAVHGCYEALRLEMEHPSAAFVVYVATIEGIGVRSKTGHQGQLFGSEETFGYPSFSLFQFDDADVFDFGLIWPMRKACRELIGNLLRGGPRDQAPTTISGSS